MYPLEIKNLVKDYDKNRAVNDISFSIEDGEIFGLLGPNGSGKTTIISVISTLIEATAGEVHVFGNKVAPDNMSAKFLLGVVPQEIISHGFFTVYEILDFTSGYYGLNNNKKRIDYLLECLDLTAHKDKRVAQLSGGMKRRLLIAKALVHSPRLLLLDEPTAGVDIELRNNLWKFVRELNKEGCSVLLTTHYLEEAEHLCHRVGIINKGKLLRLGQTKSLIRQLTEREFVIELTHKLDAVDSKYLTCQDDHKLVFKVPSEMQFGELVSKTNIDIEAIKDFQVREGSLEDAFLRVLGEGK